VQLASTTASLQDAIETAAGLLAQQEESEEDEDEDEDEEK